MEIDPSRFNLYNVVDTCAVWNLLSSSLLLETAIAGGCIFSYTKFVCYECLFKPRKSQRADDLELQKRLISERRKGRFKECTLGVEDLIEVEVLENRKRLGKGELSAIALAKLTRLSFLTDDQEARKLAKKVLESSPQTTPHLFSWLVFVGAILEKHKDIIIAEHKAVGRPLARYFEEVFPVARGYGEANKIG